jgi:coenzyme F420 hydrogenase subunit beta
VDGVSRLLDQKICRRDFFTPPFTPCRQCSASCPLSAVGFPEEEGFGLLQEEVISRGNCSGCGACVALCPEKVLEIDERPVLRGECTNCGYCMALCPRAYLPERELETAVFSTDTDDPLGYRKAQVAARSKVGEILNRCQDGGFVTTLLKHALERGIIDGAIVAGRDLETPGKALPVLATDPEKILVDAGSKYSHSPNLALLRAAEEEGLRSLAVVGLPCHIQGLRNLEKRPIEDVDLGRLVKLSIGLFCMGNFDRGLAHLIEGRCGFPIGEVEKSAIQGKWFIANGRGQRVKIPLPEVLSHKREGCMGCRDFTSRLSDFSVGSVGSPEGYSTVFARTKLAAEILEEIGTLDLIATQALEAGNPGIETIRSLVERKERGAEEVWVLEMMRRGMPALPEWGRG